MRPPVFLIALSLVAFGCGRQKTQTADRGLTLLKVMGADQVGDFDKAIEVRPFLFPRDHGPHPRFRTEWWYLTGNLSSPEGRTFGYQFTIFRTALTGQAVERPSDWATSQIYMAHLAVTDVEANSFMYDERFSRGANQLAGAESSPLRVWLEDWEISQADLATAFRLPVLAVKARTDAAGINLTLRALKPLILQGDKGLSKKGDQAGDASYYYSYTRLGTEGVISIEGTDWAVSGTSWMDREWSTSALGEDQIGWDWFALQLDDTTEVMYYRIRKNDGTADSYSKGTFIGEDGTAVGLTKEDVDLATTGTWESPKGVPYPSGWKLRVPSQGLDLVISPTVKDQLLEVSIEYWEGSVSIEGTRNGKPVVGRGYVELTGY
jgi:predicted secreted hydrolase